MILKNPKESNNEVMKFNARFGNTNKSYKMDSDGVNIIQIETDDKDIIKFLKEDLGF